MDDEEVTTPLPCPGCGETVEVAVMLTDDDRIVVDPESDLNATVFLEHVAGDPDRHHEFLVP